MVHPFRGKIGAEEIDVPRYDCCATFFKDREKQRRKRFSFLIFLFSIGRTARRKLSEILSFIVFLGRFVREIIEIQR